MTIKPISPNEIVEAKQKIIPPEVIQVFNEEIAKHCLNGFSRVYQGTVVDRIEEAMGVTRNSIFLQRWLDIEELYSKEGWKVSYYKPAYNETGEAYWTFEVEKS